MENRKPWEQQEHAGARGRARDHAGSRGRHREDARKTGRWGNRREASDLTGNPHLDIIQVYENKIFPQVSELLASYENLKGGLSADLVDSGHMSLSLEEKQYQILKQIEEFRNKSIAKEWLDLAINDMAKGKGLGYESEIDEYDVQSLMDTTVAHLNSEIQKFEDGESRGEIDKAMFTDLRPEDRQEIANNVRNFVNEYSNYLYKYQTNLYDI